MNIKHWYTGVVEDVNDPLQNGRVRVRAFTYHTPSLTDLPTTDLPWATVMMPVTQPSMGGIGQAAVGLMPGSWVFGFFRDGDELQDPVVVAVIPSSQTVTGERGNGFADPTGTYPISPGPDMPAGSTTFGYGSNEGFRSASGVNQFTNIGVGAGSGASSFQGPTTPITVNGSMASVIAKARGEVGVRETSTNQGPGIAKYWGAVDYSGGYNDRAPWCAAFVSWCIQQGGVLSETDRPKHAKAFDYEGWARSKSPRVQLLSNPKTISAGMIVIFSSSHIGIATTASDINGTFRTVEGNTNSQGAREGNGVWEKSRNISLIRSGIIIG